jgi:integrase
VERGAGTQMAMTLNPNAANATRNRQGIVINHAAEGDLCPFIKVRRFKTDKKIKPPFTIEWVNEFCEHANPYLAALALFLFATGARISEALAVQWEHVDLPNRKALIPKSKIGEQREVDLPARLVAALANLTTVQGRSVFWYRTRGSLRNQWEVTVKRGLECQIAPGREGLVSGSPPALAEPPRRGRPRPDILDRS